MSHECYECFDGVVQCLLEGGCTVADRPAKAEHERVLKEAFQRLSNASQQVILVPLSIEQMRLVSSFIWQYIGEMELPDKKHDAEMLLDAMKIFDDVLAVLGGNSND